MADAPAALAREWISAYAEYRDEDLAALAHPEIVIQPRRGQGKPVYRGVEGVRGWLAATGTQRRPAPLEAVENLDEHRAIAEGHFGDQSVIALFETRDGLISSVSVYLSDREMLALLGRL